MRKSVFKYLLFFMLLFTAADSFSQCAMCRRVAETGQETKQSKQGLNAGILYLLAIPYVLGGVGIFMWHKNKKN